MRIDYNSKCFHIILFAIYCRLAYVLTTLIITYRLTLEVSAKVMLGVFFKSHMVILPVHSSIDWP